MSQHYNGIIIKPEMVNQILDPAKIAELYDISPMLLQSLKKILLAGKCGKKNRESDLIEAMGAIKRQLQLDLESENG